MSKVNRKPPFSVTHPHLLEEWDYRKNQLLGLEPVKITHGSRKKVWWKCSKEHSWCAVVAARVNGTGCPYCSNKKVGYGNDLLTNFPKLCKEWDYEKNQLGPENFTPGSHKKVWWKCLQEHSWSAQISNRQDGNGCPYCSNKKVGYGNDLLTNHPELCQEWDYEKNELEPESYLPKSNKKVWWRCSKGHSWLSRVNDRQSGNGCPKCAKSGISKASQEWLDSLGIEQREVKIGKYYVDGFDPETNTVYEFLGDFWHGNPKIFSAGEINPISKKSYGKLYLETKERIFRLGKMGYKVIYIWEKDFKGRGLDGRY